jgi:ribonucleoside-diphosphate reductase alpha chain
MRAVFPASAKAEVLVPSKTKKKEVWAMRFEVSENQSPLSLDPSPYPGDTPEESLKSTSYHGIHLDLSRDQQITPFAMSLLRAYYMKEKDTSPQESFARAAIAYCDGDLDFAQRIYDYASKGWFMFSSPVLSNAVLPGEVWKALPISCFLAYVPDTLEGLITHSSELRWLSVKGGGVGGHWSAVRSVSGKSPGPIPFLKTVDADMTAYRQGTTRKGSYAAYLDVSHPDVLEFLQMRLPTGGDPNRKCLNLHNALNISDDFMEACIAGKEWHLRDPADGEIRDTMPARELFERILEVRSRTGEPYLNFIDAANRGLPQPLKDLGLKINGSNLCNEIHLPTSEDRTAVCCLSSLNLALYDEWKDTSLVRDLIKMLDNVLEVFIQQAPDDLSRAKYSATRERSLGLGAMGFHAYLQKNRIPWESAMAKGQNLQMFRHIQAEAEASTKMLATERGEYLDGIGSNRRNAHLLAIAPNANSSILLNISPSIEPWKSNAYTHRTRAGSHQVRNPALVSLLTERISDPIEREKVWSSITTNAGSVQHLDDDLLSEWEREVFKTAFEIDQRWVVGHAADRQPYICQGQSVNLFFPAGVDRHYVLQTHIKAWKEGLKGLYYLRTTAGVDADKVSAKIERVALKDYVEDEECLSCQG